MILGNKNEFAIQIQSPDCDRSIVAIWLSGFKLGNSEEEEYVKQVYSQLFRLLNLGDDICHDNIDDRFDIDYLIRNEEHFGKQVVLNLGESFDDFIIRVMSDSTGFYFFWKLVDSPFFNYDDSILDKGFKSFVSQEELIRVLDLIKSKTLINA